VIGRVYELGTGFKGVAAYLRFGHLESVDPDRVAWVDSRNLPTEDPRVAARIMAATARDAGSRQPPVYHFSISFDPGDPVDPVTMRQVADRALRDLRLDEHQALIMAHRDRDHPHMHLVVNRVHPERLSVWSNWYDYPRIERSLRAQEVELGLRIVPGHLARVPGASGLRPQPRLERGDDDFLREVQERAGPVLERARSWAELERELAGHGLSVRVNGRGMSVTDGRREVKASEVDRAFSRSHLEKRLGRYGDYRARMAVAESARAPSSSSSRAEAPARRQEADAPSSTTSATQAPAPTPQPAVRAMRRPQFGDAGHGINELFGYTGEGARSAVDVERAPAPRPRLAEPAVPPLTTKSGDGLLVRAAAASAPVAPEPVEAPASQPSVHSSSSGTGALVHPDARPVEPPKPNRPRRRLVDFLEEVKARGGPVLARADSWEALERGLADRGLSLRVKGGGFVVTDGEMEVKASEVGRAFSRFHLENRLGLYPSSRASTASTELAPKPAAPESAGREKWPAPIPVQPPPRVEPAAPVRPVAAQPVAPPSPAVPPAEARKPAQPRRLVDFLREVKERAGPVLERAGSWRELERGLAHHGLSLRVKGGGFVVTDGHLEVRASEVGRAFSRLHLENRLGRYPYSRVPTASTKRVPEAAVPQSGGLQERPAPAPVEPQGSAPAIAQQAGSPASVRHPLPPSASADGAAPPPIPAPEPVRPPDPPPLPDAMHVDAQEDEWIGAAFDRVAERLRLLEAAGLADELRADAHVPINAAVNAQRALTERQSLVEMERRQMVSAAKPVYEEPSKVVDALLDYARDETRLAEAKELLRRRPEHFGKLVPDFAAGLARLKPWNTFGEANREARALANRLENAARRKRAVPTAEDFARAAEEVRKAVAVLDAATAERTRVSTLSSHSLMQQTARALQPLLSVMDRHEIERRLAPKLTPGAASMLPKAIKVAVELAEGPRRERGGYGFEL
jgi:Relaxase/Mobilisation nuclease domain